ncbi:MAG: hypothetical protein JKY01_11005 [Pseudomonadales bacterium]|nr:hypothetical protein [Pseudomonadales bacterium]
MRVLSVMKKGGCSGFDNNRGGFAPVQEYPVQLDSPVSDGSVGFRSILNGQRRSEFDVSDTICVSDTNEVCQAVKQLFGGCTASSHFQTIEDGFEIFDTLYEGRNASYHRCETDYHNKQHVLDVTLATARLIWGYQKQSSGADILTDEEVVTGLLTALFHDVGYLRKKTETGVKHGAEFTKIHVSRGADFLADLLKRQGMACYSAEAKGLVHFTGYEKAIESIETSSPKLRNLGYLIGTADVIAQMADRTYLEKCENFLYPEFLLGGMCSQKNSVGRDEVIYASSQELMAKTPAFMSSVIQNRLVDAFQSSYRFVEACFQGSNLYLLSINKNFSYLTQQLNKNTISEQNSNTSSVLLRRNITDSFGTQTP